MILVDIDVRWISGGLVECIEKNLGQSLDKEKHGSSRDAYSIAQKTKVDNISVSALIEISKQLDNEDTEVIIEDGCVKIQYK